MSPGESIREMRTAARKNAITEVALKCFADNGFHKTSMRDIANAAGVSLGNLYNHFDNKDAMIAYVAEIETDAIERLIRKMARKDRSTATLDWFVGKYLKECSGIQAAVLMAEIVAEGLRQQILGDRFLANRQKLVGHLAELIDDINNQNLSEISKILTRIPSSDCAEYILDLTEGLAVRRAFERQNASRKDLHTLVQAIHALLAS